MFHFAIEDEGNYRPGEEEVFPVARVYSRKNSGKGWAPTRKHLTIRPSLRGEEGNNDYEIMSDKWHKYKFMPLFMLQRPQFGAGENDGVMPIFPNRVYCCGGSLSGKSFQAANLAREYSKLFPDNRILLFSGVKDDECYDGIPHLLRVVGLEKAFKHKDKKRGRKAKKKKEVDEDELCSCDEDEKSSSDEEAHPLSDLEKLRDSLVIFDDTHALSSPAAVKALEETMHRIQNAGRHFGISVICTRQVGLGGQKTVPILQNCFQILSNPQSTGRRQLASILTGYMGLSKEKAETILSLPTRYILLNRTAPNFCLWEKGCMFL